MKEEYLRLYNQGLSQAKIAKMFGVSRQYVSQVLKTNPDYQPRTKSVAAKIAKEKLDACCPSCSSKNVVKNGTILLSQCRVQNFLCRDCGRAFIHK